MAILHVCMKVLIVRMEVRRLRTESALVRVRLVTVRMAPPSLTVTVLRWRLDILHQRMTRALLRTYRSRYISRR